MSSKFAERMQSAHKSFIREILKVTEDPSIISFAGGLPNARLFPVKEMAIAAQKVLSECGETALQYSTTEGFRPLREYIAARYSRSGLDVSPEDILITSGSQQGLDLLAKVFLDSGDRVLVERPTYLAALQSFGLFQPVFHSLTLHNDGVDIPELKRALHDHNPKAFYSVPSFQNPTGITYSLNKRAEVAKALDGRDTVFIEDDPYGDLRFKGQNLPPMKSLLGDKCVLLGTFSKTISPGVRLGWMVANPEIMEKAIIAKQASDLHTSCFMQMVVNQYLRDNDLDRHISRIRAAYGRQRDVMVEMMEDLFPDEVRFTRPEGGMFLWLTLPEGLSSFALFNKAIKEKVAFVPGQAFFADGTGDNTMRLNFSNSDEDRIEEGMRRLARAISGMIDSSLKR